MVEEVGENLIHFASSINNYFGRTSKPVHLNIEPCLTITFAWLDMPTYAYVRKEIHLFKQNQKRMYIREAFK